MSTERPRFGAIDMEWVSNDGFYEEKIVVRNKKCIKRLPKNFFLGLYLAHENTENTESTESTEIPASFDEVAQNLHKEIQHYYTFRDMDSFLLFFEVERNTKYILLTHFMKAELQFFSYVEHINSMIRRGWRIKKLNKWTFSIYNERLNVEIVLRDVMRLIAPSALDNLQLSFLGYSSKDFLVQIAEQKQLPELNTMSRKELIDYLRTNLHLLTEDERKLYNFFDCYLTYLLFLKFYIIAQEVAQDLSIISGVNITIPPMHSLVTLGMLARYIVHSLDAKDQFLCWAKNGKEKEKEKELSEDERAIMNTLIELGKTYYQGGGIITNLTHLYQPSKIVENVTMYDVNSLYPFSAIIASLLLSPRLKDYRITTEPVNDLEYQLALVEVEGEIPGNVLSFIPQRIKVGESNMNDEEQIQYSVCYPRRFKTLMTVYEYEYWLSKNAQMRVLRYIYVRKDHPPISSVLTYMVYFLNKKNNTDKKTQQALYEFYKLALNIAYGKIAERRLTNITNPLFACTLTAVSRIIMITLIDTIMSMGRKVYHVATDSIITDMNTFLESDEYRSWASKWLGLVQQKVTLTNYDLLKHEKESSYTIVLSLKRYCMFNEHGEIVKEAHLGIPVKGSDVVRFWEVIKQLIEREKNNRKNKREMLYGIMIKSDDYYLSYKDIQSYITKHGVKHYHITLKDLTRYLNALENFTAVESFMFEDIVNYSALLLGCGITTKEQLFIPLHDLKYKAVMTDQFHLQKLEQFVDVHEYQHYFDEYLKSKQRIIEYILGERKNRRKAPEWLDVLNCERYKIIDLNKI